MLIGVPSSRTYIRITESIAGKGVKGRRNTYRENFTIYMPADQVAAAIRDTLERLYKQRENVQHAPPP